MHKASSMSRTASTNVGYLVGVSGTSPQQATTTDAPLLYNVIQTVDRLVLLEAFRTTPLSSAKRTRKFFRKCLMLPELFQDGLMCEVSDVLRIVERRRCG